MDIKLEEVSLVIQGRAVLDEVTATVRGSALTCLLGVNGSGKTMLHRVLSGELKSTSGRILLADNDVSQLPQREIARHFAIVPQGVGDPPFLTVGEMVALGRFRPGKRTWWGASREDRDVVDNCLHRCQVDNMVDRPVAQLSGGEKQRVWLAFSLAQEKEFLLLDEALDALDFVARRAFFQLITEVASSGKGVILTTHDLGLAREFADEIVMLEGGRVSYQGPPNAAPPTPR